MPEESWGGTEGRYRRRWKRNLLAITVIYDSLLDVEDFVGYIDSPFEAHIMLDNLNPPSAPSYTD